MAKVTANSARLEADGVWIDSTDVAFGCIPGFVVYPEWHHVVVCRHKNDSAKMAVFSMPAAKWEDSLGDDWEIVHRLSPVKK